MALKVLGGGGQLLYRRDELACGDRTHQRDRQRKAHDPDHPQAAQRDAPESHRHGIAYERKRSTRKGYPRHHRRAGGVALTTFSQENTFPFPVDVRVPAICFKSDTLQRQSLSLSVSKRFRGNSH
jgi:hypothetical protein